MTPFDVASDIFNQAPRLDATLELPLLGLPTLFRSNSPALIAVVSAALGSWRELPPGLVEPGPPLRLDLLAQPGQARFAADGRPEFVFRAHGDSFLAASGDSLLSARLDQGQALAFVTPDLVADEASLRAVVIEGLPLLLATRRNRKPVQAAAVVRGETAILLCESGEVGLVTLCYACARAGFQLLAEDVVYVSQGGGPLLWGNPSRLQLPPDRLTHYARRALVCLIERQPGQASRLAPLAPAAAATVLGADTPAALTSAGVYRLSMGDPASAAALLGTLVSE